VDLSTLGSLASLASLGLTGWVAWNVREIRRGVLYKARAPELLKNLGDHRAALSTYLTGYAASARDFQAQLAPIQSVLQALEDKVGAPRSQRRREVRDVRLLVERSRDEMLDQGAAEKIYDQLTFLAESLVQDLRDRQWLT
jgi:hypothetical protein